MAALSADRNTPERTGDVREPPVAAGAVIFAGALAAINAAGLAVPASGVAALKVIGRCDARADNTGGQNGDIRARVRPGIFRFDNSAAGDAIGLKDVGASCFVVDDQTVALTSNSGARPVAGSIFDVDNLGVWVRIS